MEKSTSRLEEPRRLYLKDTHITTQTSLMILF